MRGHARGRAPRADHAKRRTQEGLQPAQQQHVGVGGFGGVCVCGGTGGGTGGGEGLSGGDATAATAAMAGQ